MARYDNLRVLRHAHTTTITLSRPERRNPLTLNTIEELISALNDAADSDALAVVIAADGPVFCAGHDFSEMLDKDLSQVQHLFARCASLMTRLAQIPQPVIASVHALATGAGCQLVASCDLVVASSEARFATPGGKGGLFCTTPLVAVGRAVGAKRALEMGLSGDPIDAPTALSWGLVNQVVAPEQLESATAELVARVTRGSVESRTIGKRAFYRQMELSLDEAYDYASDVMARASLIEDSQESIRAFLEKRPANFSRPAPR